jgi:hypothetical protein
MPAVTDLGRAVTDLGVSTSYLTQDSAPDTGETFVTYYRNHANMGYTTGSGRYADTVVVTLASGTVSATGAQTGVELGDRSALRLDLTITGTPAGTNPTLDVAVQTSPDNVTWTAVASFAQQTAAGTTHKLFGPLDRWVRVSETIGGTGGPSFVRTITGEAV